MIRVVHYITEDGTDHFDRWLRMQNAQVRARVQTRIDRIELGNFGDHHGVGSGVFELRLNFGPGYRIFYGRDGDELVILLGGGSKRRQSQDIEMAQAHWRAYRREKRDANN